MIWKRQSSLLFVSLLFAACSSGPPPKPDIPNSVSPGWKLASLDKSGAPAGVPAQPLRQNAAPDCWKATYSGSGDADVWLCWYQATGSAFDALQRARAEAQTVKFQEAHYFVLLKWNHVTKADLEALVRALEKALQPAR